MGRLQRKNRGFDWRIFVSISLVFVAVFSCGFSSRAADSQHIKIVLNPQGGAGGTSEIYAEQGGTLPQIQIPARRGYAFEGYFTGINGKGTQYYNSLGTALLPCDFSDTTGLYASWTLHTYSISYENMAGAVYDTPAPSTHTYGTNTVIADPTKDGYQFFGWQVNDSPVAIQSLILGAREYTNDIRLTAVWNRAALVAIVNNTTTTVSMSSEDLQSIFGTQMTDSSKGVTASDLNSEEVKVTMTASDLNDSAEGAADIIGLAQGETLKFYDFSVSKTVTKAGESPVTTGLNEIPNTVEVRITLTPELQNRSSYRVYRYHNEQPEAIPMGGSGNETAQTEYYEMSADATQIILHTRRLSTYAIVGGERTVSGMGNLETGSADIDVQARVQEGGDGAVYSLTLAWGDMKFSYSVGNEWDPDEHRYTDVKIYSWIPDECYTEGNNEIKVYNHSNADVMVNFTATPVMKAGADEALMDGVDILINQENKESAEEATNVILSKVPYEHADAPSISGYLRMIGSPTDPAFYEGLETNAEGYVKVAEVAVTIEYLGGVRTPKSN